MLPAGQRLGRYEIISFVSAGGMGEVYRARDSVLDRTIALKILPPEMMRDPERIRRFMFEAKAASALNHPHIVVIHDVGEAIIEDDQHVHFIAAEFIEGETLRSRIAEQCDFAKIARYLGQVADALAKAHGAGIVHRDLKPENIMITPEGYAKVLDFGLAKLKPFGPTNSSETNAPTAPIATASGHLVGTAGYMSPEQVEGREVDHRSDIFSLGCVAYELVTGKPPFRGNSPVDTMHRVLYSDPPVMSELRPGTPFELQRIVRKCLAKVAEERYQSMKELAIDLRQLSRELASGSSHPTQIIPRATSGSRHRRRWIMVIAAGATIAITVPTIKFLQTAMAPFAAVPGPVPFATASVDQVTVSGDVYSPNVAITPDGKFIVYIKRNVQGTGIVVQQVGIGGSMEIVHLAESAFVTGLAISPFQQEIYYSVISKDESVSTLFRIPLTGGVSSEVARDVDSTVTFDPQGRRFAFLRYDQKHRVSLLIHNLDGTESVLTAAVSSVLWSDPAWSPDGKIIAFANLGSMGKLTLVDVIDSRVREMQIKLPKRRSSKGAAIPHCNIAWFPDGKGLAAIWSGGVNDQIIYVSYPDGVSSNITNDDRYYFGLSIARDTARIVSTVYSTALQVWTMKRGVEPLQVTHWPADYGASGMALKPDGKILYVSDWDLWQLDPVSGLETQITRNIRLWSPRVSNDGRSIVFASASRKQEIWRVEADGTHPRKIADGNLPSLSPDGRQVVYECCFRKSGVWSVSIDGGVPRQVIDSDCQSPAVAPDGKRFAALDTRAARAVWSVFDLATGRLIARLPSIMRWSPVQWSPDGNALISVTGQKGVDNLVSYPVDGSDARALTHFTSEGITRFDVAPDGTLALLRGRTIRDVVVITDESSHHP